MKTRLDFDVPAVFFRCSVLCQLFERQQQQNDAGPGQNMADACNSRNRGICGGGQSQCPHLDHTAPRQQHRCQRNADIVYPEKHPEGLDLCKVIMGSVQCVFRSNGLAVSLQRSVGSAQTVYPTFKNHPCRPCPHQQSCYR